MEVIYRNKFSPDGYNTAVQHARVLGELTRCAVWLGSPFGLRGIALEPDELHIDTARELHESDAEVMRAGLNACLRWCKGITDPFPTYLAESERR